MFAIVLLSLLFLTAREFILKTLLGGRTTTCVPAQHRLTKYFPICLPLYKKNVADKVGKTNKESFKIMV